MSDRALGFVEEWISENIHGQRVPLATDAAQAKGYALRCVQAAQAEGIPELEIQESIDDLPAFMAAAITEANERASGQDVGATSVPGDLPSEDGLDDEPLPDATLVDGTRPGDTRPTGDAGPTDEPGPDDDTSR